MLDMTTEKAIEIIKEVCAKYQGTLADHQNIQTAIKLLEANVKAAKRDAEAVKKEVPEPVEAMGEPEPMPSEDLKDRVAKEVKSKLK